MKIILKMKRNHLMKLKQTPSQHDLSTVQAQDIHRVTKRKVLMSRGKAWKKWIGLPKPSSKDHLEMVDVVSKGVLEQVMERNLPKIREIEKQVIIDRRKAIREYLQAKTESSLISKQQGKG